ncbi:MAG: hypothetical protein K8R85_11900 [Bacteroidetes bacterium]|nr:hypothetical protein [Bacteroidota bacterium]
MIKLKQSLVVIVFIVIGIYNVFSQSINSDNKYTGSSFKMPENIKSGDYIEKTVIIKVKPQFRSICLSDKIENELFKSLFNSIQGNSLVKKFPHTKAPERLVNERGERLADLTLIYEFSYAASFSLEKVISKFLALQLFEYAEPHYLPQLCYTPNRSGTESP